jgi:hypothetical protein
LQFLNARNARKLDLLYVNKIRNRCSRFSFFFLLSGNGISPHAVTLRWRSWGDAICRRHQHAVALVAFARLLRLHSRSASYGSLPNMGEKDRAG